MALALVLYIVSVYLPIQNIFLLLGVRTLLLLLFVAYIVKTEDKLKQCKVPALTVLSSKELICGFLYSQFLLLHWA